MPGTEDVIGGVAEGTLLARAAEPGHGESEDAAGAVTALTLFAMLLLAQAGG